MEWHVHIHYQSIRSTAWTWWRVLSGTTRTGKASPLVWYPGFIGSTRWAGLACIYVQCILPHGMHMGSMPQTSALSPSTDVCWLTSWVRYIAAGRCSGYFGRLVSWQLLLSQCIIHSSSMEVDCWTHFLLVAYMRLPLCQDALLGSDGTWQLYLSCPPRLCWSF